MKGREKTRQVWENWSQQLEHKQSPKGTFGEGQAWYHGHKLVDSLIGWEVTVTSQGLECHLTFLRGRLHIAQ